MNGDYADVHRRRKCCRASRRTASVKLTKDPDSRAAMGNSSGGSAALIMAWFRNDLYHRVLTTSGTVREPGVAVRSRSTPTASGASTKR